VTPESALDLIIQADGRTINTVYEGTLFDPGHGYEPFYRIDYVAASAPSIGLVEVDYTTYDEYGVVTEKTMTFTPA